MDNVQQGPGAQPPAGDAGVVATIVELVQTGPLALGAFTTAEILAVNGPAPGLPVPEPAVLAEAVRGLVARGLAVPVDGSDQIDVQGDLGLVLTLQQRTRLVVDIMFRGDEAQRPPHVVLLPQPEGITLIDSVDRIGLHHMVAVPTGEAVDRLREELPHGKAGAASEAPVEDQIAAADDAVLITVARFSDAAPASSEDLVAVKTGAEVRIMRRAAADAPWEHQPGEDDTLGLVQKLAAPLLDAATE